MTDRDSKIADMREMLDYLEARPDVPMPYLMSINAFAGADDLGKIAKAMGGVDKDIVGDSFFLRRTFGSLSLDVNFPRDEVCERRVVGTKTIAAKAAVPMHEVDVYEWDCPPSILAPVEPPS